MGFIGENSLDLRGKVEENKVKIDLSLLKLTFSCLFIIALEEEGKDLTFPPEMLRKGCFGDLVAGQ